MEASLKCLEFEGGLLATVEADRAIGLEFGIGEPALVSLAVFVFTIRGDGDLARALREGDNDRDRSLGVGDGSRLIVACRRTGVEMEDWDLCILRPVYCLLYRGGSETGWMEDSSRSRPGNM